MPKTLISFLGTGGKLNNKGQLIREYQTAKYSINEEVAGESSFVTSVLMDYFEIENLILIGTVKSMWEEVYRYFCDKNDENFDLNYYAELGDTIDKANYQTSPTELSLNPLEKILGENSKVVIIPYGLNKSEQLQIFNQLAQTFSLLEPDHEIILDITHSFRSLPLFSTSVIQYLQSLSEKRIHFSKVYYGMLDAMREFDGIAPIIDISTTIELQKWSTAGYAFKEYGKGQLLADLLGGEEGKMIQIFSDAVNLNYLSEIQQRLTNFQQIAEKGFDNEFAQWVVPQVLQVFTERLFKTGNKQYLFQFELSVWHREKQNFASAYIVFVESMITYVCERAGVNWNSYPNREDAKFSIRKYNSPNMKFDSNLPISEKQILKDLYKETNLIRNNIAHNLNERSTSADADIKYLIKAQESFKKIINRYPVK